MSRFVLLLGLLWSAISPTAASDLDDARLLYRTGKYTEAKELAAQQV